MNDATICKATDENIALAAEIIKSGGLVAFPTETVYGLGANGLDGNAVAGIFAVKGRPADNPLILHVAQIEAVYELAENVPLEARRLMDAFWPGALTIILPKKSYIPEIVSGGLDSVGIRMPSHPAARELILRSGLPLAAPSANSSGRPSPTLAEHVAHDLGNKIDMILDGGASGWGLESTVVEMTGDSVCVLRPGAVTIEELRFVIPDVYQSGASDDKPKSPGMKYTHYSPLAAVTLVTGEIQHEVDYIKSSAASIKGRAGILATDQTLSEYDRADYIVLSLGDRERPDELAANLFRRLREFDNHGAAQVFAEGVDERGLGLAIMNRLRKAASTIVEV